MTQLAELARPFPKKYLGKDDRGNDAVDHTVVTQRLLEVCGPYSMEVREVLRSEAAGMTTRNNKEYAGGHFVTGVIVRLYLTIDGRTVFVDETGACENAAMKDGDGERLKHAISDAIKRCSMRLGLGLHMWAQGHYYLDASLSKRDKLPQESTTPRPSAPAAPSSSGTPGRGAPGRTSEEEVEASGDSGKGATGSSASSDEDDFARLRRKFMAQVGDCGFDYADDVKPWLCETYDVGSFNDLTIEEVRALTNALGDNVKRESFVAKIEEHRSTIDVDETVKDRIERLGLSKVDVITKANELAGELEATKPTAYIKDWKREGMHPGLFDAIVGWLDEVEAEQAQDVA